MQPRSAPAAVRLLVGGGLLWAAGALGGAEHSLEEVRRTLQNLVRSVEDEGRDAEAFAAHRRDWCGAVLRAEAAEDRAASAAKARPRATLAHDEPAAAQLEGEVATVQAKLQAGVNGTKKGRLEGQLTAALPKLAILREAVAEARAQTTETDTAADALPAFDEALRESCSRGMERDRSQAAARLAALTALQPALDAIGPEPLSLVLRASTRHRMRSAGPHTTELERDAELLADASTDSEPAAPSPQQETAVRQDNAKLRSLLSQLRGQRSSGSAARRAWCAREQPRAHRALLLAQAAAKRVAALFDAHAAEEERLSKDLARLDSETASMKAAVATVRGDSSKEQALLANVQDDRRIAIKILGEASDVLLKLEGEVALPVGIGKGASGAAALLKAAHETFFAQIAAAGRAQQEAEAAAEQVAKTAITAAQAKAAERADVEMAYDRQASQRAVLVADRRAREQEAQDAATFVDTLKGECGQEAQGEGRDAQLRALEDAREVLAGAKPAAAKGPQRQLTPMERAAARMGVLTGA